MLALLHSLFRTIWGKDEEELIPTHTLEIKHNKAVLPKAGNDGNNYMFCLHLGIIECMWVIIKIVFH
jgi:hypothetical protein